MALVWWFSVTMMIQDDSTIDDGSEMHLYAVHWPQMDALLSQRFLTTMI
jgi:hypothetical protein